MLHIGNVQESGCILSMYQSQVLSDLNSLIQCLSFHYLIDNQKVEFTAAASILLKLF